MVPEDCNNDCNYNCTRTEGQELDVSEAFERCRRRSICQPKKKNINGVQMQLENGSQSLLGDNSNVLFDTVINWASPVMKYSSTTGEFLLPGNKSYLVTWWVAVDGTGYSPLVEFAVVVDDELVVIGSSPLVTGQISGSALISTSRGAKTLSLRNVSGGIIRYAQTTIQADIVIIELISSCHQ